MKILMWQLNSHRRTLLAALVGVPFIIDGSLFAQSARSVAPAALPLPPTPPLPGATALPPTSVTIAPVPPSPRAVTSPNRGGGAVDPLSANPAGLPAGNLEDAIIAEETNANPAAAVEKYRAVVAAFDAQRPNAAQAVFRLGECLRKLGRFEEAKAQYGRILREFVDQPELVRLGQKLLSETPNAPAFTSSVRAPIPVRENEDFLRSAIPAAPAAFGRMLSSREEDLRAIESALRQQRMELQKLNNLRSLTSTNRPELLTPRLIDDNRYQQLKEEYEQQLNATSSPNAGEGENKALETSRRKIAKWMNEVYRPELDYSIEFAEQQMMTLQQEAGKLKSIIAEENAENEAIAAKKRDEQSRAEATARRQ